MYFYLKLKFWEVMCDEHGIAPDGSFCGDCELELGSANVYFSEAPGDDNPLTQKFNNYFPAEFYNFSFLQISF